MAPLYGGAAAFPFVRRAELARLAAVGALPDIVGLDLMMYHMVV